MTVNAKIDKIVQYLARPGNEDTARSSIIRMFHIHSREVPELINALKERGIELK